MWEGPVRESAWCSFNQIEKKSLCEPAVGGLALALPLAAESGPALRGQVFALASVALFRPALRASVCISFRSRCSLMCSNRNKQSNIDFLLRTFINPSLKVFHG